VSDRLLLLDTASLYYRAFYGVPDSVRAPDGTPVNAVRGLLDFIARMLTDHPAGHVVACWDDDWRPDFRVELVPSYKAHRVVEGTDDVEEEPDELSPQIAIIAEVLDAYGIVRMGAPGFEADDVIGTWTHRWSGPVDIVTGDRDLFQLVDDARPVRVLYTARGVRNHDVVTEAVVTERFGIPGRAYAAFAALRGDPSDGLPGVPGVGAKTAATLVNRWPTVEALLSALDAGEDVPAPARSSRRPATTSTSPRAWSTSWPPCRCRTWTPSSVRRRPIPRRSTRWCPVGDWRRRCDGWTWPSGADPRPRRGFERVRPRCARRCRAGTRRWLRPRPAGARRRPIRSDPAGP
jgi:5'-3' exonuclease